MQKERTKTGRQAADYRDRVQEVVMGFMVVGGIIAKRLKEVTHTCDEHPMRQMNTVVSYCGIPVAGCRAM